MMAMDNNNFIFTVLFLNIRSVQLTSPFSQNHVHAHFINVELNFLECSHISVFPRRVFIVHNFSRDLFLDALVIYNLIVGAFFLSLSLSFLIVVIVSDRN